MGWGDERAGKPDSSFEEGGERESEDDPPSDLGKKWEQGLPKSDGEERVKRAPRHKASCGRPLRYSPYT